MNNLKPCACGVIPEFIDVFAVDHWGIRIIGSGTDCCNWMYEVADADLSLIEAWNTAPRDPKIEKYEKWFAENATTLAVHRIGGYWLDDSQLDNMIKID